MADDDLEDSLAENRAQLRFYSKIVLHVSQQHLILLLQHDSNGVESRPHEHRADPVENRPPDID